MSDSSPSAFGNRQATEHGPAIVARDVRKRFGVVDALRGVTLDVQTGSISGLLGPNGAGKSTFIKTLVGASRPTSGTVRVLGFDPVRDARKLRPNIGYMPQAAALYDDLSARDNIRFFGSAYGLPDLHRRVDAVLQFVALESRQHDPVYALSGGMRQRVSLACALVHEPQVLFLDEPTAGVDPGLKETFWGHFRDLASRGVTIFISTHLMDEAVLCDRLAILRAGTMLITAPPHDILQRAKTLVRVTQGNRTHETTIRQYYTELPGVLQRFGLRSDVTRIELHEDSLETVMLALVEEMPE